MLKPLALGTLLGLALATGASAQSRPAATGSPAAVTSASADDCLRSAFDLAQQAQAKKLSEDEQDSVDELLSAMEDHCDARRFTEAQTMAGQIASMIAHKPAGDPSSRE